MSYNVVYKDIGLTDYKEAWDYQIGFFTELVEHKKDRLAGADTEKKTLPGTVIIVEHPHVYTLGKSGQEGNLRIDMVQLEKMGASFYRIDRGGDITYHGPGQLVCYPVFDLDAIKIGLKDYVFRLEESVIRTVGELGIRAERYSGGTGVWIDPELKGRARKICAIGVKVSRYVTMHGLALNVNTDLSYFSSINPCGFTDRGVTSVSQELAEIQDMELVKGILKRNLREVFDLNWLYQ